MTFAQPLWFWAFGLLPFLLVLFYRNERVRQKLIEKFVAPRLAKSLAGTVSIFKRRLRFALTLFGLACIILSPGAAAVGVHFGKNADESRGRVHCH